MAETVNSETNPNFFLVPAVRKRHPAGAWTGVADPARTMVHPTLGSAVRSAAARRVRKFKPTGFRTGESFPSRTVVDPGLARRARGVVSRTHLLLAGGTVHAVSRIHADSY